MIKTVRTLCVAALLLIVNTSSAQVDSVAKVKSFGHLDLSLTAGTTGLGLELSMPLSNVFSVRTGYEFMPKFNYDMDFLIQVGDTPESKYDENGNRVETKFDRLAAKLTEFTGQEVDDNVRMIGEPTFHNWHLLVDVKPFRNKNWHFTTGFFLGPSNIAKAYNATEEMQSLLAMNMYNNIHYKLVNDEPIFGDTYLSPYSYPGSAILEYGRMGIYVGDLKNEFKTDDEGNILKDDNGNPIHKPYYMEPDGDGMVKATMKVNSFKPYLGFGYGGRLSKKSDEYYVSFDCGVMFWGGKPKVYTHDGTEIISDVINHIGSVKDYVDIIDKFSVFPVLNIKLTKRLF